MLQFSQSLMTDIPILTGNSPPQKGRSRNVGKMKGVRGERSSWHQLVTQYYNLSLVILFFPIFGGSLFASCCVFFLETTGRVRPQWTQTETGSPVKYQSASAFSIKSHLGSEFIGSIDFFSKINLQMLPCGTSKRQEAISALCLNIAIINRQNWCL